MKDIFHEEIGGTATALALNKATNLVAVAGRSIFKIYSIKDKGFEQYINLRVVKSSCNDVAWNQIDDSILASATPNGEIVTWNLNKQGYSKIDVVYQDHKRSVNKIHFHSSDPNLLISGSQDSIKVFDLRHGEAIIDYRGLNESVRDLQFSPHKANTFVAVQDNGYIQLYDIRKKDKYEQSFPGHNGPILACDWHPEIPDTLATAGRDMNIKVWNVAGHSPVTQHCIPTMESVSKIRWSYDNRDHIASCSLKRDFSINIWDIHRPFIACARFTEPHEITVGMAWRRDLCSLVSVTSNGNSNGTLYHLPMSEAYRPLEHANPVGMAINPDGDIALALGNGLLRMNSSSASTTTNIDTQRNITSTNVTNQSSPSSNQSLLTSPPQQNSLPSRFPSSYSRSRQSATRRSQDSALRPKISSRSQLDVYKCTEMNWFVKTAREYQLSNRPLAELCDHNAEVCAKLRRFQICQTWKILKLFYANITTATTSTAGPSTSNAATQAQLNALSTSATGSKNMLADGDSMSIDSQIQVGSEFSYISKNQASRNASMQPKIISVGMNETMIDDISLAGSEQSNGSTDEWLTHEALAYEAFQPKHDICGRVERLMDHKLDDSHSSSGSSNHDEDYLIQKDPTNSVRTLTGNNAPIDSETDLKISQFFNTKAYQFKFYEIIADVIADVLKYHVDNSDVQSAVSILIVLGDRIKNIVNERIPEVDRESWYYSYIDLLSKFQLWNVMAQVINLSPLNNINSINQTSTTIYTTCGTCNRPLNGKVSWICDRCKTKPSECSVCHGVVAGLMAWCQGCYHGGHLIHMNQWFSEKDFCPTGCGHMCELSQWR